MSHKLSLFGGLGAIVVESSRLLWHCVGCCCVAVANLGLCEEFELGRQAAWRPRGNRGGVVKTLMALCILLLCCGCGSRTLYAGFELGRQAAWRPRCNRGGVDKTVVGIVHSAAVCGCVSLGLCMRGTSSVVKLLGGRGAITVVSSRR